MGQSLRLKVISECPIWTPNAMISGLRGRTSSTSPSSTFVHQFSQYHGLSSGSVHEADRLSVRPSESVHIFTNTMVQRPNPSMKCAVNPGISVGRPYGRLDRPRTAIRVRRGVFQNSMFSITRSEN